MGYSILTYFFPIFKTVGEIAAAVAHLFITRSFSTEIITFYCDFKFIRNQKFLALYFIKIFFLIKIPFYINQESKLHFQAGFLFHQLSMYLKTLTFFALK